MRRREPTIDPQVAEELAALDRALAGEPGADGALTALVADVREERAVMDPTFSAWLETRAENGFAGADHRRRSERPIKRDGPLGMIVDFASRGGWMRAAPAFGGALALLIAVVVVALPGGQDSAERASVAPNTVDAIDTGAGIAGGAAGDETGAVAAPDIAITEEGAPGTAKSAPQPGPLAATQTATTPPPAAADADAAAGAVTPTARERLSGGGRGFGRKVERTVELTLTPAADEVQKVADGVVRVTQGIGGYVQRSQVSTSDGGGGATFTLRIPSARLDDALARLSKLAHVGSLTQDSADITGAFVSATERLSDARAERRALLRALGKAKTANEIASLRARLRVNRSEIAAHKGELEGLRRRADLTTVSVNVEGTGKPSAEDEGGTWTPGDALRDAGRVLEVAAGVALIGLAGLVPLALLAIPAALAARSMRRRRREAALDGA